MLWFIFYFYKCYLMPFSICLFFSSSFFILLLWILFYFISLIIIPKFILWFKLFSYLNSSGSYSFQWWGLLVLPEFYIHFEVGLFFICFVIWIMSSSSVRFLLLVFLCGSHIFSTFWKFLCRMIFCLLL